MAALLAREPSTSAGMVISAVTRRTGMRMLASLLSRYLTWLCRVFQVTPESITKDRRGNMPPPSGGIASF
jgi:hypothetical protein